MPRYVVRFCVPADIAVDVDQADDEDEAGDVAWVLAEDYLKTLAGDHRNVTIALSLDGIGADEVTEVN